MHAELIEMLLEPGRFEMIWRDGELYVRRAEEPPQMHESKRRAKPYRARRAEALRPPAQQRTALPQHRYGE